MRLDIETPRGQQSVQDETRMAMIFERHNPGYKYCQTARKGDGAENPIDGYLWHVERRVAVFTQKTRYHITRRQFAITFNDEWKMTHSQALAVRAEAIRLRLPMLGFLYIRDDDLVLVMRLADPDGTWLRLVKIIENDPTQATCNGGIAFRTNSHHKITGSKEYSGHPLALLRATLLCKMHKSSPMEVLAKRLRPLKEHQ